MNPTSLKYLFLFFALLLTCSAFSQLPDTVVVYEYEYITDTVWIKREVFDVAKLESISNATLLLDTTVMNASLMFMASNENINCITLTENQTKTTTMKKTGLFTLLFLSLHSVSFAQPEISLRTGLTQFWSRPSWPVQRLISFGDHYGIDVRFPMVNSKLSFSVGYEQHGYVMNSETQYWRTYVTSDSLIIPDHYCPIKI